MAVIIRHLVQEYKLLDDQYGDKRTQGTPLMGSPLPIIAILGFYLWFVLKAGPNFMKNRKPFKLDRIIQIYNLTQVVICGYLTINLVSQYKPFGYITLSCMDLTYEETPNFRTSYQLGYLYTLVKIIDLLDTIFFVLRKKQSQISFLHVYHHTIMVVISWGITKYLPTENALLTTVVNSFVHTIMYFYYFMASRNKEIRANLWWKKYLTQLQITQFALLLFHAITLVLQPSCTMPKPLIYLMIPQNLFVTLMFLDFYKKTYLKKCHSEKTS